MLRSHRPNLLAIHYSAMICHIGLTMQRLRNSNSTRLHSNHLANAVFGLLALGLVSAPAIAQGDYPVRAITLIVPFAAGGPTDVVARIVVNDMSRTLGQMIVVENIVGAGGTTAGIRAMRSPPDGYTIMMGHMGTHAASVALYPNLAYNPSTDFEPVGMVAGMPVLILARKDFPAKDLKEFVNYLRDNAAKLNMAHAGVGSVSFTTCLLLNSIVGVRPKMTAFQGTGPAMNALAAGRVDYMCDQVVSAVPQIQAGTIKAYAVGTAARNPALPNIPTSIEAGLPEFQASAWNALFAPKGTPQAIVAKLNAALGKALDDPETRKQLLELGGDIPNREQRTPRALAELVKNEIAKWTPIIKAALPAH
jgi:tripartite-type tricarboxylate transporter receptor subunit TctC